jgi:uncharacterized repeat protein (TIGR01451 family)
VLLISAAFVLGTFLMPVLAGTARAQTACDSVEGGCNLNTITLGCSHDPDSHGDCDLAVDKQVSVNGGAFVEADTPADAAQAHVGDTITWKITVTNESTEGFTPTGTVYVNDLLPTGVAYVSSSATSGNYITSGLFANHWLLPLLQSDGDGGFITTLPATLTITSTSNSTGLFENIATLDKYDNGHCDGGCVYGDSNPDNDSNDAWIDPSAPPAVLGLNSGDPQVLALTNTGSSTVPSLIAGILIVGTLGIAGYGRLYRRPNNNSL